MQPAVLGLNWAWYFCQGYNSTVIDTWRLLNSKSGRFPGGTGASFWDWENGVLLNESQIGECLQARGLPTNCTSVHDCSDTCACDGPRQPLCEEAAKSAQGPLSAERIYREFYAQVGVKEMVWQPNLFFDWRNQSMNWLHSAMTAYGAPLPLVELGNEHYLDSYELMMPTAADYVGVAAPVAAAVQSAGGQVGLTAEPCGPLEGAAAAAWKLRSDPRRALWNANMSAAAAARGVVADAWVLHSYTLGGVPLNETDDEANWGTAWLLYAEASLSNAREYVTALASEETQIWLTEYGASSPCVPWPTCEIPPGKEHKKSAWVRDAIYSPAHAIALIGVPLHALATPSARITAANLHAVFAPFYEARGLVEVLPRAGPAGADALNVSVLAQLFSHFSSPAPTPDRPHRRFLCLLH